MALRIVFMGTAELACASLAALVNSPAFEIAGVVTQPDRPKGRDLKLQPSPVKKTALAAGLPVWQPQRARQPEFVADLARLNLDLLVVAAYGQILPLSLLQAPRLGAINVHTSLLPKYRGAAPIQWAILDGQQETGVTIMKMAEGLDTGDILSQKSTPITDEDNAATLHDRLAVIGAELLVQTIFAYDRGEIVPQPQVEGQATYARKITREDGKMQWDQPARVLWNRARAFTPWPGAYTFLPTASGRKLLKIIDCKLEPDCNGPSGTVLAAGKEGLLIACGSGALRVTEVQLEGARKMPAAQMLAGHPIPSGMNIG